MTSFDMNRQTPNNTQTSAFVNGPSFINEKVIVFLLGTLTALVLFYQLINLTSYPPVFIDEPWYANAAWNWLKNGVNFDAMHAGAREDVIWPLIGNFPLLVSFATLGLGLFQARLVSWIFGVVLIIVTVIVGRRSYGNLSGYFAALFLALSPPFIQASHYVRPDIMLSTLGMTSYFLTLIAFEKNRWWAHLLAGLLIGLSFDIHQNASLFAIGLGVLYLFNYRFRVLKQSGTWLFVFGGLLGVAYYAFVYVLPNASDFFNYYRFSLGISHQMPLMTLNPLSILKSAREEIGRFHFFENSLDFALIGASVVFLALRRKRADRFLLIFTGSVFIAFVLLVGNKHDIYAILLYPCFMLMVAETLVSLVRGSQRFSPQSAFASALLGLFLFSSLFHLVRPVTEHRNYDYYAITDHIKSVIPVGARVMGLPHWWLGLADYDYSSSLGLTFSHFINGDSLEEGFDALRPEYLIVDTGFRGLLVNEGYYNTEGFEFYKLPRKEFENFLSRRGDKVLEFSNPWHGRFEVYLLEWD
jgi:4-amino-4-deoxy-L-arabinose transferase-like glycosyltransferase